MHIFERQVGDRRYRIAAQSVWDSKQRRSVARQIVLGPATPAPVADLSATSTVGARALGDVGALVWVAEQLDLIGAKRRFARLFSTLIGQRAAVLGRWCSGSVTLPRTPLAGARISISLLGQGFGLSD